MNVFKIFIILAITIGTVQTVSAQDNDSGNELKISDIGLEKTKDLRNDQANEKMNELNNLLEKLTKDRKDINKILQEPDEDAFEDNNRTKQIENYTAYGLWLLLAIISICIIFYL